MGMHETCRYERFSLPDVAKFERRLKKWCEEACMPKKSMLVFDMTGLKIEVEPQFLRDNTGEYYEVKLPRNFLVIFSETRKTYKSKSGLC